MVFAAPPGVDSRTPEENEAYRQRLVASFIVLPLMSGLVVALRMYAKLRVIRNFGVEDIAALAAYVCPIAASTSDFDVWLSIR